MEGFLPDRQWLRAPWTCNDTTLNVKKWHQELIRDSPKSARTGKNRKTAIKMEFWHFLKDRRSTENWSLKTLPHSLFTPLPFFKTYKKLCSQYFMGGYFFSSYGTKTCSWGSMNWQHRSGHKSESSCLSYYAGAVIRGGLVQGVTYLWPEGRWIFMIYFSTNH